MPDPMRAVWVHLFDDTLKTPAGVDGMLEVVDRAGFNTVIVEVVRRHDAYYDSDVLVRTPDPAVPADFDLIDHVLREGHARGLTIQAWVPLLPAYHHQYDGLAHPPDWLWTRHGRDAPEADRWVTRTAAGQWSDYLDPGLPEVRAHVAAVMAEIAARYPVDAIHLDYVRYPDQDTGYHPRALDHYRQETGASGTPVPVDPVWSAWRRQQVDRLLAEVRAAVEAASPGMPITAAVIAQGDGPTADRPFEQTAPFARYFQDWQAWVRQGALDAVMPMNYFRAASHGLWFDQWADFQIQLAAEVDALVVGGQAGYLNTADDSLAQLRKLDAGLDGISLYSYQQTVNAEPYDALFDRLPGSLWPE